MIASATSAAAPGGGGTTRAQWLVLAAAFLGWMFDGVEMGIFPLVARPALQSMLPVSELGQDQFVGVWMGRITALFLVGAAAGGLGFGWLGDRLGRVRAMTLSILTYSIFTGLCYFAQQPWHLGVLRFIAAFGMGGEWSLGVALVMEAWPPGKRALLAGVIGMASNAGYLLIALLGLCFDVTRESWRWIMIAGAAPAFLALAVQLFVPESERWRAAVRRAAARPVREIVSSGLLAKTLLGIALASIALIGTWGSVQWLPLWADQMTGGNVPTAKAMAQILVSAGAIVGSLFGALAAGRIGRRPAYFALCLLSLLLCGWLFRSVNHYGAAFLVMVTLVGATTAAFYGWLPLYLPELFPTRVRATGQGLCYNAGRILAAAGALTQGQLVAAYGGSYARAGATVTLIYLLGLALIWLAPETKDQPLPE
ncbi:MAG TPA: MFS transporter [Candidatus Paceibacterota bacterium]|nr:MFS transporter [Verrucomicrobiota bacterium]HSA10245.1 MFS transporter [Candidatus Paceibacterota bacterium]